MSPTRVIEALRYPSEWTTLGLLPDAILRDQDGLLENDPASAEAPEHFRLGAVVFWTRDRATSPEVLSRLLVAASADPDPGVAQSAVLEVLKHPNANDDHLREAISIMKDLPDGFRVSRENLRSTYEAKTDDA